MFRKTKQAIGLDIGSSAIKAVELRGSGKNYKVSGFGIEPIEPEAIVDGAIAQANLVSDAVRRVLGGKGFSTKDVAVSLSGSAVIVKKVTMPRMNEAELRDAIPWEAEQYIPFDIQDVNLDYEVLESGGKHAANTMDVLLVAAKRDKIADYTGVISQAGRTPVVVDVDVFAIQNAYEANYDVVPGSMVALLNAGASGINVNILNGAQSVFTRDISMGGYAYTDALQKELNLTYEQAERLKQGEAVDGAGVEDAEPVLHAVSDQIMLEIQKTFDFFRATAESDRLDRILLCGGSARVAGFSDMLAERFETSVEMLDPFRRIEFSGQKFGVSDPAAVAPTAVVAVGLALRRAADR